MATFSPTTGAAHRNVSRPITFKIDPIALTVETLCINYNGIQRMYDAQQNAPKFPNHECLFFSRWLRPECGGVGTAPFSGGEANPASCFKRVTTGPRAKWLSILE